MGGWKWVGSIVGWVGGWGCLESHSLKINPPLVRGSISGWCCGDWWTLSSSQVGERHWVFCVALDKKDSERGATHQGLVGAVACRWFYPLWHAGWFNRFLALNLLTGNLQASTEPGGVGRDLQGVCECSALQGGLGLSMGVTLSEYFLLQAGWPQLTLQDSGTWVLQAGCPQLTLHNSETWVRGVREWMRQYRAEYVS